MKTGRMLPGMKVCLVIRDQHEDGRLLVGYRIPTG